MVREKIESTDLDDALGHKGTGMGSWHVWELVQVHAVCWEEVDVWESGEQRFIQDRLPIGLAFTRTPIRVVWEIQPRSRKSLRIMREHRSRKSGAEYLASPSNFQVLFMQYKITTFGLLPQGVEPVEEGRNE